MQGFLTPQTVVQVQVVGVTVALLAELQVQVDRAVPATATVLVVTVLTQSVKTVPLVRTDHRFRLTEWAQLTSPVVVVVVPVTTLRTPVLVTSALRVVLVVVVAVRTTRSHLMTRQHRTVQPRVTTVPTSAVVEVVVTPVIRMQRA